MADAGSIDGAAIPNVAVDAGQQLAPPETRAVDAASSLADAGRDATAGQPGATSQASSEDQALHARVIERLRVCEIVVGSGPYDERPIEDAYDRCSARCLLAADCESISALRCRGVPEPTLGNCLGDCTLVEPENQFVCGADELLRSFVCDGFPDCRAGEDEQSCPAFACRSGAAVTGAYLRCNGLEDCADGSDEDGCASYCQP